MRLQSVCASKPPKAKRTPKISSKGGRAGAANKRATNAADAVLPDGRPPKGAKVMPNPQPTPSLAPAIVAEMKLPNTRLLASIRGRCFSMVRDYWTYEFCPMQSVRQFRQEGNRVGVQFSLGTYDKGQDKVSLGYG